LKEFLKGLDDATKMRKIVGKQDPSGMDAGEKPSDRSKSAFIEIEIEMDKGEAQILNASRACRKESWVEFNSIRPGGEIPLHCRKRRSIFSYLKIAFLLRETLEGIKEVNPLLGGFEHQCCSATAKYAGFGHITGYFLAGCDYLIQLNAFKRYSPYVQAPVDF
jgi:hypothetical protein